MSLSDEKIVELYLLRDQNAITETDIKYRHYLTRISYNILKDYEDCQETVNDTYYKAWNSIPPQIPQILGAYLGKINRQTAIDIYRRKHSRKRRGTEYDVCYDELEEVCTAGDGVEKTLEAKLLGETINKFLKELPEKKRILFLGRYFYMDSIKDIAGYTGQSESNVKVLLHRIRKELKEYLIQEGFEL